jgi:hypothetical protein
VQSWLTPVWHSRWHLPACEQKGRGEGGGCSRAAPCPMASVPRLRKPLPA